MTFFNLEILIKILIVFQKQLTFYLQKLDWTTNSQPVTDPTCSRTFSIQKVFGRVIFARYIFQISIILSFKQWYSFLTDYFFDNFLLES